MQTVTEIMDLYVASGSNEFPESSSALIDRLYINDGKGHFVKSPQVLPAGKYESYILCQACWILIMTE